MNIGAWAESRARAAAATSPGGAYPAICDEDMLQRQLSLPREEQKLDRIAALRKALGEAEDE